MDPLQQPQVDSQHKTSSSNSRKWIYVGGVIIILIFVGFLVQKYYPASGRNVPVEPVQKRLLTDAERVEIQKQLAPTKILTNAERAEIQKQLTPTKILTDAERAEIQKQINP